MVDIPFIGSPVFVLLFVLLIVWSSYWKGMALWRAGRRNELGWFITLFLINTLGILEILYLFVFSKRKREGDSRK